MARRQKTLKDWELTAPKEYHVMVFDAYLHVMKQPIEHTDFGFINKRLAQLDDQCLTFLIDAWHKARYVWSKPRYV